MIATREYRPEDAASFLRLHDSVFPPMSAGFWHEFSQRDVTAAVAVEGGEVVGSVPFQFRLLRLRPGAAVRVAWEWSVCVRDDLRGTGIGSRLMETAKGFLRGRAAAMAVYRNDEFSPPYRFYRRSGHHDLLYIRPWVRTGPAAVSPGGLDVWSWEQFLTHEAEALGVFAEAYAAHGGFPERHAGYYGPAVQTPEYAEVPVELSVLVHRAADGALGGYAILGLERHNPALYLMEIAVRGHNREIASSLLAGLASAAAERNLPAVVTVPDSAPICALLEALGFVPRSRAQSSLILMLHALDPEALAQAAWRESAATEGLEVLVWTPEREVWLHRARRTPARRVTLEMKEETLTRLVTCRLDLEAALAQQSVTALGADEAALAAIAQALPLTPWIYHHLDFV